jgi:hypothetical protein
LEFVVGNLASVFKAVDSGQWTVDSEQ